MCGTPAACFWRRMHSFPSFQGTTATGYPAAAAPPRLLVAFSVEANTFGLLTANVGDETEDRAASAWNGASGLEVIN